MGHSMSVQGWTVLLCKDCGPQTQPLAVPQFMEQLVLVGEKKKGFWTKKGPPFKNNGKPGLDVLPKHSFFPVLCFCSGVHMWIPRIPWARCPSLWIQGSQHKTGAAGVGYLHCWAPPLNLGAKLGWVSFAPIDQYQQRWASLQRELEQLIQLLTQILPWRSLSLPTTP